MAQHGMVLRKNGEAKKDADGDGETGRTGGPEHGREPEDGHGSSGIHPSNSPLNCQGQKQQRRITATALALGAALAAEKPAIRRREREAPTPDCRPSPERVKPGAAWCKQVRAGTSSLRQPLIPKQDLLNVFSRESAC